MDKIEQYKILSNSKKSEQMALHRLVNSYLYSEDEKKEEEFVRKKHQIENRIKDLSEELDKLSGADVLKEQPDFTSKANYFIMIQSIMNNSMDYIKFANTVDRNALRKFVQSTTKEILMDRDKIHSITYKNGIKHYLIYKK